MDKQQDQPPRKINISEVFKKYQGQLKSFIAKRVTAKEDREDILQDRKRKHREKEIPQARTEEGETFILKEVSECLFDADNSPEKEYMRSLVWEELDKALAELPDEQRIVFELNELQNFSFKEISESSGIPVNTLISRKRYAVLYLRERLYNIYEELLGE